MFDVFDANGKKLGVVPASDYEEANDLAEADYPMYSTVKPQDTLKVKPVSVKQDATWVNKARTPAQNPVVESGSGTFNYDFLVDGQKVRSATFQSKPTDVQLKMFALDGGLPSNVKWEQRPAKFSQVKESVDQGETLVSLFPRTAKSVGRGEGGLSQAASGVLDVASLPGRALGAGIDWLAQEDKGVYANVPSMFYTGGDVETPSGAQPRGTLGMLSNEALRDPANMLMLVPGVAEGRFVSGVKSFVPTSKRFTNVADTWEIAPGVTTSLEAKAPTTLGKVATILEKKPNVKLPSYTTPALEGTTLAGTEAINAPSEDRKMSIPGMVVGAVLPAGARAVAPKIKEGAVTSITQDLKLKPTDMRKKFAPELEVLFKNKDIPLTGGTAGILENVSNKLRTLGEQRTEYLKLMESRAKSAVPGTTAPYYDQQRARDIIDGTISGLTVDMDAIRKSALDDVDRLFAEGGMEESTYETLTQTINAKVDDLIRRNPLTREQMAVNAGLQNEAQFGLYREHGLSKAKRIFDEGQAVIKGEKFIPSNKVSMGSGKADNFQPSDPFDTYYLPGGNPDAVALDIATPVGDFLTHYEQSVQDLNPLMPLSLASKRRSLWFDQGAVNNPKTGNLTPDEKRAAELLWGASTKELAKHPRYADYSGQMRQYVPIENALEGRMPALDNRNSISLNPLEWPALAGRSAWRSNPGLRMRYGAGEDLMLPLSITRALGSTQGQNLSDLFSSNTTSGEGVALSANERALVEAIAQTKAKGNK